MLNELPFYFAKLRVRLKKSQEPLLNYYRKKGIRIGRNCLICSRLPTGREAKLLTFGDDVVVSTDVCFVTHDFSISKVLKGKSNLFGKIEIGNNCFIGERSTILYGVRLADNIIVAAGSVVTKSFSEKNIIIGGNPARIISSWQRFAEKSVNYAVNEDFSDAFLGEKSSFLVKR